MTLPISIIDAFSSEAFRGNPAAVCLLEDHIPSDEVMAKVAMEMNLAETAFVARRPEGGSSYDLRWFTPSVEVDLCGHATLAAAHALWSNEAEPAAATISFHTRSGVLKAKRHGERIELDFPSEKPEKAVLPFLPSSFPEPIFAGANRMDWFIQLASSDDLLNLNPKFDEIEQMGMRGLIVTAPGFDKYDFVSRFFAPQSGVNEDPVTGSAHCALCPYWAERLGSAPMLGYQASKRGGEVDVELRGARVALRGHAVTTLTGEFIIG